MKSSDSPPGLPTWLFVVTDLALIAAAAAIAVLSPAPLSSQAMLLIVGCVGLGAVVGLLPLVARYERLKNAVLDDRQRALETLAQTVHETAQQISIATGSLHEIADLAQKNLRHAEHLPHKLQEKIAEFQAQLADANDAEKAELEQELTALRSSESERLEAISTRIAKTAAEWGRLEAASTQHLTALQEAFAQLPGKTGAEFARMQKHSEQVIEAAGGIALKSLQQAEVAALGRLAEAYRDSLATLEARVAQLGAEYAEATRAASARAAEEFRAGTASTIQSLEARIAQLTALASSLQGCAEKLSHEQTAASPATAGTSVPAPAPLDATFAADAALPAAPDSSASSAPAVPPAVASPPAPKRQRRTRKEEAVPTHPPFAVPADSESSVSSGGPAGDTAAAIEPATAVVPPLQNTPAPEPAATPTAPPDDEPTPPIAASAPAASAPESDKTPAPTDSVPPAAPPVPPAVSDETNAASPPAPVRKRAPRKSEPPAETGLDLGFEDFVPAPGSGHVEKTLSSDGATRLIATAYIGIGNRLFIRGEGPGLSWERGVPLQFVSIGKWRWETNDATAPIRFKLYKNDEHECVALGEKTLEPGHLHELVAAF